MMEVETRGELHKAVELIGIGQWLDIERGSFCKFFPNPSWPQDDDHLEVPERAEKWFSARGLRAWETPTGMTIERITK